MKCNYKINLIERNVILLIVLLLGWVAKGVAFEATLTRLEGEAMGAPPRALAWGDMDADGRLELAVGAENGIHIYRYDESPAFPDGQFRRIQFVELSHPVQDVAWGDLNGDAYPELVVALSGRNRAFRNQGGSQFVPFWVADNIVDSRAIRLVDADSTLDGRLDLVVANVNAPDELYLNTGNGFEPFWESPTAESSFCVEAVDLNEAQYPVFFFGGRDEVRFYTFPYQASSTNRMALPDDSTDAVSLSFAQVDGTDGLDMYIGTRWIPRRVGQGQVTERQDYFYRHTFNGSEHLFVREESFLPAADATWQVMWGDLDTDFQPDILVAGLEGFKIYRYHAGVLADQPAVQELLENPARAAAWGDADNDADLDLVILTRDTDYPLLYRNDQLLLSPLQPVELEFEILQLHSWDISAHSGSELVGVSDAGEAFYYYWEDHQLVASPHSPEYYTPFVDMDAGFVNTDSQLDVIIATQESLYVWDLHQADTFTVRQELEAPRPSQLISADLDNDQDWDLIVQREIGTRSTLRLMYNETGQFQAGSLWETQSSPGNHILKLFWQDLNFDIAPDVVVLDETSFRVYRNISAFLESTPNIVIPYAFGGNLQDAILADMGENGTLDVVVAGGSTLGGFPNRLAPPPTIEAWQEAPDVQFEPILNAIELPDTTHLIEKIDIDNDGDWDIVTASGGTLYLYKNQGDWRFSSPLSLFVTRSAIQHLVVGDVDNDGDSDIITASRIANGSELHVYLNYYQDVFKNQLHFIDRPVTITSLTRSDSTDGEYRFDLELSDPHNNLLRVVGEFSLFGGHWQDFDSTGVAPLEHETLIFPWAEQPPYAVYGNDVAVRFVLRATHLRFGQALYGQPTTLWKLPFIHQPYHTAPVIDMVYPTATDTLSGSFPVLASVFIPRDSIAYSITLIRQDGVRIPLERHQIPTRYVQQLALVDSLQASQLDSLLITLYEGVQPLDSLAIDLTFTSIVSDYQHPTIRHIFPANGAEDVPRNSPIYVVISDSAEIPLNDQSVTAGLTVYNHYNAVVPGTVEFLYMVDIPNLIVFYPEIDLLPESYYYVVVDPELQDLEGHRLLNPRVWSFKTLAEPPTQDIVLFDPVPGALDVDPDDPQQLVIQFDEGLPEDPQIPVRVYNSAGVRVAADGITRYNPITRVLTFDWSGSVILPRSNTGTPAPAPSIRTDAFYTVHIDEAYFVDSEAPYIYSFATTRSHPQINPDRQMPAPGDSLVPPSTYIEVEFDRFMNSLTIQEESFYLVELFADGRESAPIPALVSNNAPRKTARLTPNHSLRTSTWYRVYLTTQVKDISGVPLAEAVHWTFRTRQVSYDNRPVEVCPPPLVPDTVVVALPSCPYDNGENVPITLDNITLKFSEALNGATVNTESFHVAAIYPPDSLYHLPGIVYYNGQDSTANFLITGMELETNREYQVQFSPDTTVLTVGGARRMPVEWQFRTVNCETGLIVISDPDTTDYIDPQNFDVRLILNQPVIFPNPNLQRFVVSFQQLSPTVRDLSGTVSLDSTGHEITFVPNTAPEDSARYRLQLNTDPNYIRLKSGNVEICSGEFVWNFQTPPAIDPNQGGIAADYRNHIQLMVPFHGLNNKTGITIQVLCGYNEIPCDALPPEESNPSHLAWGDPYLRFSIYPLDLTLEKTATLSVDLSSLSVPEPTTLGFVYRTPADTSWVYLGGTVDEVKQLLALPVRQFGEFMVVERPEVEGEESAPSIRDLAIQPRVFYPADAGVYDQTTRISFTLGHASPVTLKIYNGAGVLERRLLDGERLAAGHHSYPWDGQNNQGQIVPAGLYIVTVVTDDAKAIKTVGVWRR